MATLAKDFSIEEKLIALLSLQKIDSKIDEIKTLKGELPMEVSDLEDEVEGLQTRINNVDASITSMNNYIQSREDLKKDAAQKIKKYEEDESKVKNSREFEAIAKEIEMQGLEIRLCDKQIKDTLVDLHEEEYKRTQSQNLLDAKSELLVQKQSELQKIVEETIKEESALSKLSDTAKEKVDPRLFTAYERIRTSYKNGLAVVPVLRDSCGGCFNVIPPQRQAEIMQRKKIIVCEHCGRILTDSDLNDTIAPL